MARKKVCDLTLGLFFSLEIIKIMRIIYLTSDTAVTIKQ
jgi:hypothetical protein